MSSGVSVRARRRRCRRPLRAELTQGERARAAPVELHCFEELLVGAAALTGLGAWGVIQLSDEAE